MIQNPIKIYARIKPVSKRKYVGHYFIQEGSKEDTLVLQVRDREYNEQHNKAEHNQYKFHKVFDQYVTQQEIFNSVAKPIVDSVLQGYNGTIFAYGQTGSGKTFTITGGPEEFEDRGLIPRAIEYVFQKIASEQPDGTLYTVCITYLQIYNEAAYDLLSHHQRMARLEDLPKLNLLDDTDGYLHIRNLSLHPVTSENEALNLLFLGDTNRAVAETPLNQASSRSHCMFTIHLAIRKSTWKNSRRAKLHFVDLAGSERLNKKGGKGAGEIDGKTINETRHINLSLHYLEQVITALAEAKRVHVPYRNCIITTMLRDSIGGNCLTSMVATLSLDHHHLPETSATCRFAQRVALVKNEPTLNEDKDPMQEISVLKSEVKRLKDQIELLTSDKFYTDSHLSPIEEGECRALMESFLENSLSLKLPMDLKKIEFCCNLLREAVIEAKKGNDFPKQETRSQNVERCMKKLLQQRNDEIAILTELLRKQRRCRVNSKSPKRTLSPQFQKNNFDEYFKHFRQAGIFLNKQEQMALKEYIANPAHTNEIDNLKAKLRMKHTAAKKIHDKIEENKARIVESRKMLAKLENGIPESSNTASRQKQLHSEVKGILEMEQSKYYSHLGMLRDLKNECDHLTHSIKQAEESFLNNFQCWWVAQGQASILTKQIPQKLVEKPKTYRNISNLNTGDSQECSDSSPPSPRTTENSPFYTFQPHASRNTNNTSVLPHNTSSALSQTEYINLTSASDERGIKLPSLSKESMGDYFICSELSFNADNTQNADNNERSQKTFQKETGDLKLYHTPHLKEQCASTSIRQDYNSCFPLMQETQLSPPIKRGTSESVNHNKFECTYISVGDTFPNSEYYGGMGDYEKEQGNQENVNKRNINTKAIQINQPFHTSNRSTENEILDSFHPSSAETKDIFKDTSHSMNKKGGTQPNTPPLKEKRKAKIEENLELFCKGNVLNKDFLKDQNKTSFSKLYEFRETSANTRTQFTPNFKNPLEQNIPSSILTQGKELCTPLLSSDGMHEILSSNVYQISAQSNSQTVLNSQINFANSGNTTLPDRNDAINMKECKEDKSLCSAVTNINSQNRTNVCSWNTHVPISEPGNKTQISIKDIPLTGDKEVDDEIIAFYEAKQAALQRQYASQ